MAILFLQLATFVTVFFDIPISRQLIVFLYFTFVPGFLIIKLLKLTELDNIEIVLFSVGLSVAFLMIGGLFLNEFGFLSGISQPFSLIYLMIFLNMFILVTGFIASLRDGSIKFWGSETLKIHPFMVVLLFLPILSIV